MPVNENRSDTPPLPPLAIALAGGFLSVLIVYPINFAFIRAMGSLGALIVTVPVEEMAKVIGVIYLALRYPDSLGGGKIDGVKLGGLAGLAFGLVETAIGHTGVLGIIFSTPLHIMCSGLVGIGLVIAAASTEGQDEKPFSRLLNRKTTSFFFIAMGVHFIYNLLAFTLREAGLIIGFAGAVFVFIRLYKSVPQDVQAAGGESPAELLSEVFSSGSLKAGEKGTEAGFCNACGAKVKAGQKFCSGCGQKLQN